jgi:hypothetical protein
MKKDKELIDISSVTTTTGGYKVPEKKVTSTSSLAEETEQQRAARIAAEKELVQSLGFERAEDGSLKDTNPTIGDLLDLKKYTQESERINKAKALNAGLYNAVSTIGDIISAGVGGNVYKREKDTIAADAAKDTDAKKKALLDAEKAAKDKDRQRYADAVKAIQDLNIKHMNLRDKISTQTTNGYTQPEVSQTVTTKGTTDPAEERRVNNYYDNVTTILKSDMSDEEKDAAIKRLHELYFGIASSTKTSGGGRVVSSINGNKPADKLVNGEVQDHTYHRKSKETKGGA